MYFSSFLNINGKLAECSLSWHLAKETKLHRSQKVFCRQYQNIAFNKKIYLNKLFRFSSNLKLKNMDMQT